MPISILKGKRIVMGVTGSIAAYKAAILASGLTQHGAEVDVIMTEAATRFVTPLTFQALTGRPVYTTMWETDSTGGLSTHIAHVALAHQADLLLIAPCTAHTITRLALGIADDLLSVTALAAQCPILIAPAMDAGMYENPVTQSHVEALTARGVFIAGPEIGRMASGLEGLGRFMEPEEIIGHCQRILGLAGPLAGRRVVVSAGPTHEAFDPVRFISNHSSGKQGFAIAQAAIEAGAEVTLIAGPLNRSTPAGATRVDVEDARSMCDAVLDYACTSPADALIMAAAVADFRPSEFSMQKIKKGEGKAPSLMLSRNPDILMEVAKQPQRPRITIGFAAESQDLLANARDKLARKKLDLIVANDITAQDAGFSAETNRVLLISADAVEELPLLGKDEVAWHLISWLVDRLAAS